MHVVTRSVFLIGSFMRAKPDDVTAGYCFLSSRTKSDTCKKDVTFRVRYISLEENVVAWTRGLVVCGIRQLKFCLLVVSAVLMLQWSASE